MYIIDSCYTNTSTLPKALLTGRCFPRFTDDDKNECEEEIYRYFYSASNKPSNNPLRTQEHRRTTRYVDEVFEHLSRCGIPKRAVSHILVPQPNTTTHQLFNDGASEQVIDDAQSCWDWYYFCKDLFYQLTRERYILEAINDYAIGNGISDCDLLTRQTELCNRYGVRNFNLDTYKHVFVQELQY